jgi:hypothetical protein
MEWKVVQLTADIASQRIIESHWTATEIDGIYSAYRYGSVGVPEDLTPSLAPYDTITEEEAIAGTQEILGPEYVAATEASILAEIELQKNPVTVSGTPWVPPAPPPAPPPPAPPPEDGPIVGDIS